MTRKILNGLDLNGQRIQNIADGSSASDAVTKAQLDAIARGLDWKNSVRVATTANITLSGTQTIDGVAVIAGDRVLVKDQTTTSENGIYVVAAGAWSRAADADDNSEVSGGMATTAVSGTTNGDSAFILVTDDPIDVGVTGLSFTELGGSGTAYTAGNGIILSGSTFSVDAHTGIAVTVDGVAIDPAYSGLAKRFAVNVPTSTSAAIVHNLGTLDVIVQIYEVATGIQVETDVTLTDVNTVTLTFASAPTAGQYRCVVLG